MALILIKHGADHPVERLKIECANEDDVIVLIQDGVFWAITNQIDDVKAKVYAVQEDLCARSYAACAVEVARIGYPELVDIICEQEKAIT